MPHARNFCKALIVIRARALSCMLVIGIAAVATSANGESTVVLPMEALFHQEQDIPLGPWLERFDYQSLDPSTGRLFIAEMSAGKLLTFDIKKNAVVAESDDFANVTGVLAVPERQKLYASIPGAGIGMFWSVALSLIGVNDNHGRVAILNSQTLAEIARVPAGVFPNGIAYAPDLRRVFVTDEYGRALTVIEGDANKPIARIDLDGQVGNVRYDPATKRIYAAVKSTNELVTVDPLTAQVIARAKLVGGRHPHGLIIAPNAAIGFVACDQDDRLLAVSLEDGRVTANLPIARKPDVLAVDPKLNRLYVASETGQLSVIDIRNAAAPVLLGTVQIADGAHTVEVDPVSDRLFLPLGDVGGKAVLRILRPNAS